VTVSIQRTGAGHVFATRAGMQRAIVGRERTTMPAHRIVSTTLALLLVTLPSTLRADPITVTGGHVQVETSLSLARILLTGRDFALSTGTEDFFSDLRQCAPCEPNVPVSLGARWAPTGINGGSATVNGVHFSEVFFGPGSSGTFTTPAMTLAGSGPVTVTLPFTFRGTVTGFASSAFADPVFTTALAGSGTARARFNTFVFDRTTLFSATDLPGADFQLEYVFSGVSPTPEPATLLLMASGALVLEARRRRRTV
jgi:hypothetical protein